MRRSASQAFTLIELLVVIAIIAILAALLFPVFNQAKTAAKQTVGINNVKQISIGIQLYLSDNDDRFPIGIGRWWDDDDERWRHFDPWYERTAPYLADSEIRSLPMHPRPLRKVRRPLEAGGTHIGINPSLAFANEAISATALHDPAGTVSLTSGATYSEDIWDSPYRDDPELWKPLAITYLSWASYGPTFFRNNVHHQVFTPGRTWIPRPRPIALYNNNVCTGFADGHVKAIPIHRLIGPGPAGWPVGAPENYWDNIRD